MATSTILQYEWQAGALTGLLAHWLWFIHGEHDNYAGTYVKVYLLLIVGLPVLHARLADLPAATSVVYSSAAVTAHFAALFGSTLLYRLVFSPLKHIPGPWECKVSKLYHFWRIRSLYNHRFFEELHSRYGDVVRSGPNEVTLSTPEAFRRVYGPESSFNKALFYDGPRPLNSLVNQRDPVIHARWRKVWDQAFSQKALDSYEPTIYLFANQLVTQLESHVGVPTDLSAHFERYTWDILGRLGLDHDFGLLQGRTARAQQLFHKRAKVLGPIVAIPWFIHASGIIPGLRREYWEQNRWIQSELLKKRGGKPERNTIIDHVIIDAFENGGFDANFLRLQGDWMITIAAGIEPMMKCLTNMAYYLIKDPEKMDKLRTELDTMDSLTDYKALQRQPYLNALIHETLRLNPSLPAAGTRVVPPEGMAVNGVFIPGGTTVMVPQHMLFRRSDCFVDPLAFVPERWTTRPELVRDASALQPWSAGRHACVGKHLGLMEIRVAAALVFSHFDLRCAPGSDGSETFEEMTDYFTSLAGPLRVVLERRAI